jgi:hypothetical protein
MVAAMRALCLVALSILACNSTPDDAPLGSPLSDACNACLGAEDGGGCGAAEALCAAASSCDDALLCDLKNGCWKNAVGTDCAAKYGCAAPGGDAGALLDDVEACARSRCAAVCDFPN